jgi:hypothetical protein
MSRWHTLALLAVTGLAAWGSTARAQVEVRAPFVHVMVGPNGVYVQAPFVTVNVPKRPGPVLVGNPPPVVTAPAQQVPALTFKEFVDGFKPREGKHQARVVHPVTGQPVMVEFTLPPGTPEVRASSRQVEFDYGQTEVEVRFTSNGGVKVDYKD